MCPSKSCLSCFILFLNEAETRNQTHHRKEDTYSLPLPLSCSKKILENKRKSIHIPVFPCPSASPSAVEVSHAVSSQGQSFIKSPKWQRSGVVRLTRVVKGQCCWVGVSTFLLTSKGFFESVFIYSSVYHLIDIHLSIHSLKLLEIIYFFQ